MTTPVVIRTYAFVSRLDRVPVPHTNDAVYALTADGRRWVAKREAEMGFEALLAEAACWLLARAIRAPVPDAAFCDDPGERAWLSACVENVTHWSPGLTDRIANVDEAGAVLALDTWVLNEARHRRNILVEGLPGRPARLWAIDADEAIVGHVDDYRSRLADVPSIHNHARGLPIAQLVPGARAAARCAAALAHDDVRSRVRAACAIAGESRADALADAVLHRAGALTELVEHYLDALQALR